VTWTIFSTGEVVGGAFEPIAFYDEGFYVSKGIWLTLGTDQTAAWQSADTSQTAGWQTLNTNQTASWQTVDTSQTASWSNIET
jgi:hypothetical protein